MALDVTELELMIMGKIWICFDSKVVSAWCTFEIAFV